MDRIHIPKTPPIDTKGCVNVAAQVPLTEAEGPGKRYAVWVQGCPLRCVGCCNPHMLEFKENQLFPPRTLAEKIIQSPDIEGVTFIGGEPFSQAQALSQVAHQVQEAGLSVMVFTGWTLSHIQKQQREDWNAFLSQIDLLVDGPYIPAKHVENRRWIGSENQQIHFLTKRYAHLEENGWDTGKNTIEIRLRGNEISINGFPHQDITHVLEQLASRSLQKGVSSEVHTQEESFDE